MVLISLDQRPELCRVELDGQDISTRLKRIEIDADCNFAATVVRLTLADEVFVIGEPGRLEFRKGEKS